MNTLHDTSFTAAWLMEQYFPPVRYVVDGVIPEGFCLLVAPPKFGKSWLVLGLGLAVSAGTPALGVIPTGKPRPVLYAALEDGPRRLQSRMKALAPERIEDTLTFVTNLGRSDIFDTLQSFVDQWSEHEPVVILDTLGKAMPPAVSGESSYERDYRVGGMLKAIADSAPGAAIVVVHHTRKAESVDFLDAVSGTQGLAGSADTIVVLSRERLSKDATLRVTSRDAAEGEYRISLERVGSWVLAGGSLKEAAEAAQTARASAGVGDRMGEIIAIVSRYEEGVKAKDVRTLAPDVSNVDEYLRRAVEAGRIEKRARGIYGPVRTVTTVSFGDADSHTTHDSHTSITERSGR
ncbi:AAA family ATPase [Microbacterium sp. 1.5R]|uniref:AAA family ATPase n=1 Tax=Microbacterium sp. 1.5R TaxID=1916917 RepID=UPI0016430226|nr:AAA family ATPase [Microbacterium sp. 1.5R]